jgi:hypothetical protein
MTADNDAMKYTAITCFLLAAILYAVAAIATYQERMALLGQ